MNNQIYVESDGTFAYAYFKVRASKLGLVILSGLLLAATILLTLFLIQQDWSQPPSPAVFVLPILLGLGFLYLFWNLFGQEYLRVGEDTIAWAYHLGLFKTQLKVKKFTCIDLKFESFQMRGEEEIGKIVFYECGPENPNHALLHNTSILVNRSDAELFAQTLIRLLQNDFFDPFGEVPLAN